MAVNRVGSIRFVTDQNLPFTNPVVFQYTAQWKPAERIGDPNVEVMTVSGSVEMVGPDTLLEVKTAVMADIQVQFGSDTIEEDSDLS